MNPATADIAVMALYLLATFGLALRFTAAREKTATAYFLAGRNLPWYLIGPSYYASNMSGASFVGLTGASYAYGLAVFHYEWTAALVLAVFAVFFLPVFLRNRIFTTPEYLELRYDRKARTLYSCFTLATLVLIDTAGALYAGAVVLQVALPGMSLWLACALIALLTGAYTIAGGLKTVVVTDTLQAAIIVVATLALGLYGLSEVGGWEKLISAVGPERGAFFKPADDAFMPWPGIMGVVLLGFYYWTFNQYFVQRALAARSIKDGRRGALFAGLLKLPNLLFMIVPGLVAFALFPGLERADQAFPMLAFELLPAGLRAFVLAALLAAIMSSLDSALNAAASLVTMDLVRPRRPAMPEENLVRIGKRVTAAVMAMAALYAPLIAGFGTLFEYFQSTLAYLVPSIVAVFIVGLVAPRIGRAAAFRALIVMLPLGLILFLAKEVFPLWSDLGLPALHFTYMAMIVFAAAIALLFLFGLDRDPEPAPSGTMILASDIAPDSPRERLRPFDDHRILAGGLILLTAALLVWLA